VSPVLPDYLQSGLRAVVCGTAVATASRDRGGYYAGSGNEFWAFLFASRLTEELLGPDSDGRVLEFGIGLTDLVKDRAASSDRGLSGYDVGRFIVRMKRYRPRWIAFHGKTAAKEVSAFLGLGRSLALGVQTWTVAGIPVYVLPSSSGSNRDPLRLEGKTSRLAWFKAFKRTLDRDEPEQTRG
jgi:TDG/mug DNA glycosylase family protein